MTPFWAAEFRCFPDDGIRAHGHEAGREPGPLIDIGNCVIVNSMWVRGRSLNGLASPLMLLHLSGHTAGTQETTMTKTRLDEFLDECITRDPDSDGLSLDALYGLYISWCGLRGSTPVPDRTFRAGLRAANIGRGRRAGLCPGLAMTGPAARDYIVHREFPLALPGISAGVGPAAPMATDVPARTEGVNGDSVSAPAA